jgi:hypothetical protein
MDLIVRDAFLTPLAATAALLPYVRGSSAAAGGRGHAASSSPVRRVRGARAASSSASSASTARPSRAQRIAGALALLERARACAGLPGVVLAATRPSGPPGRREERGAGAGAVGGDESRDDDDATLVARAVALLLGPEAGAAAAGDDGADGGANPSFAGSLHRAAAPWVHRALADLLAESFRAWEEEGASSSAGMEEEEDEAGDAPAPAPASPLADPDAGVGAPLRQLGLFLHPAFQTLFLSVLRALVAVHVRLLVTGRDEDGQEVEGADDADEHRAVLGPALRWATERLLPWAAAVLLGGASLERLAAAVASASAPSSSSAAAQADPAAVHALRAARVIPTALPPWPSAQVPCVYTPQPERDDGTGGAAGTVLADLPEAESGRGGGGGGGRTGSGLPAAGEEAAGGEAGAFAASLSLLRRCDTVVFEAVHARVCAARSEASFSLVRDFPESTPALVDLRAALPVAGDAARAAFVATLTAALQARLLHPGVATSSILDVFLSAVRAVRVADGSGVLLSLVADPIQTYLRTRPDTIRCIVASLTEDTESELYAELVRRDTRAVIETRGGDSDDEEETAAAAEPAGAAGTRGGAAGGVGSAQTGAWEAMDGSFMQDLLGASASGDAADEGMGSAPSSSSSSSSSSRRSLARCLFRLLGPRFRYGLPTDPFARGDALFRSHAHGVFASLGRSAAAGAASTAPAGPNGAAPSGAPAKAPAVTLWSPAPSVVETIRGGTGRFGDLLSLLVNIYGSKEMFVNEYRTMLSERLLAKPLRDWGVADEERTLELLKLRFGEASMASPEIMVRDLVDSKRVSVAIAAGLARKGTRVRIGVGGRVLSQGSGEDLQDEEEEKEGGNGKKEEEGSGDVVVDALGPSTVVEAVVLSHKYWPSLPRERPELAAPLAALFRAAAVEYGEARKPRELLVVPAAGEIEVEVTLAAGPEDADGDEGEMGGRTLTLTGSPQQVSALIHMGGRRSIPLRELSAMLKVTTGQALRIVGFWAGKGVLAVERGGARGGGDDDVTVWVASCVPTASADGGAGGAGSGAGVRGGGAGSSGAGAGGAGDGGQAGDDDDAAGGDGGLGPGGDDPEAVSVWSSYVLGMVSNLGAMPLDRVHNTLKMFASMGDYPCACVVWPQRGEGGRSRTPHPNLTPSRPLPPPSPLPPAQTRSRRRRRPSSSWTCAAPTRSSSRTASTFSRGEEGRGEEEGGGCTSPDARGQPRGAGGLEAAVKEETEVGA